MIFSLPTHFPFIPSKFCKFDLSMFEERYINKILILLLLGVKQVLVKNSNIAEIGHFAFVGIVEIEFFQD